MSLLHLLQITSSALPVGAYSYSEGLESLVQAGDLTNAEALQDWVQSELLWGSIRVETAIALRIYHAATRLDIEHVSYWNQWLSASRETEELREQNWQMGRALVRLLLRLESDNLSPNMKQMLCLMPSDDASAMAKANDETSKTTNYVTAFSIAAVHYHIEVEDMLLGYLHSWASNLVSAGIKLIPLGQTAGQQVLSGLYADIEHAAQQVMTMPDDDLSSCTWGLATHPYPLITLSTHAP
ncbi:MAG: urease accessory protein UreF [Cyanobacteria bacterium P01_E01_bin.6]